MKNTKVIGLYEAILVLEVKKDLEQNYIEQIRYESEGNGNIVNFAVKEGIIKVLLTSMTQNNMEEQINWLKERYKAKVQHINF